MKVKPLEHSESYTLFSPLDTRGFEVVYAATLGDYVKVGQTKDIPQRMSRLRFGGVKAPAALTPVLIGWWLPSYNTLLPDEHKAHLVLSKWRAEGEWFHKTEEVVKKVIGWTSLNAMHYKVDTECETCDAIVRWSPNQQVNACRWCAPQTEEF